MTLERVSELDEKQKITDAIKQKAQNLLENGHTTKSNIFSNTPEGDGMGIIKKKNGEETNFFNKRFSTQNEAKGMATLYVLQSVSSPLTIAIFPDNDNSILLIFSAQPEFKRLEAIDDKSYAWTPHTASKQDLEFIHQSLTN